MCYPLPGPRCSSHARKAMTKAYREYEQESSNSPRKAELYLVYREKRAEFFSTPAGQKWLDNQIAETGDPNGSLALAKEVGERTRAKAMEKMREANLQPVSHTDETTDHGDISELRRIERARNSEMTAAERLMEQARDKLEYAEAAERVREVLTRREELRRATNDFTQAYEAWTLALEEVDAAEKREEGIEE